jgi:hypothetical protein
MLSSSTLQIITMPDKWLRAHESYFSSSGEYDQGPRHKAALRPMSAPARAALLQTRKNTSRTAEAQMYLLDYSHPTELSYERREALMREARDARLA